MSKEEWNNYTYRMKRGGEEFEEGVAAIFLLCGIFLIGIFITSFFSSYYPFSFEKSEGRNW